MSPSMRNARRCGLQRFAITSGSVVVLTLLLATRAQGQTLRETTGWLHDFVQAEGTVLSRDMNWRDRYRVDAADCEITILHDTEDRSCTKPENKTACGEPHIAVNEFRDTLNLRDADPARIRIESNDSFRAYTVTVPTANELPRVTHEMKVGDNFMKQSADSDHEVFIVVARRDAASRVADAFKHAAALCGAKASPF
jgi:hypothetical protein